MRGGILHLNCYENKILFEMEVNLMQNSNLKSAHLNKDDRQIVKTTILILLCTCRAGEELPGAVKFISKYVFTFLQLSAMGVTHFS